MQAKEEWLNRKCAEMERMTITDKLDMYKSIREIRGQKIHSLTGSIITKERVLTFVFRDCSVHL